MGEILIHTYLVISIARVVTKKWKRNYQKRNCLISKQISRSNLHSLSPRTCNGYLGQFKHIKARLGIQHLESISVK